MLTDVHAHSLFSADGLSPLADMARVACEKGVRYFGISEHFDYDYREQNLLVQGKSVPMIDEEGYFAAARGLQARYAGTMRLLAGAELGYAPLSRCCEAYERVITRFRPDFVVNSVHTCDGADCFFPEYFTDKEKDYAYRRYLDRMRESLEAPYPYDVVAHLGYVARNAPYPDPKLRYEDYAEVLDDILKRVIEKGKILEVNSSSRTAGSDFLPDTDILTRYFSLGGRLVSYGSDAHGTERICDKRGEVCAALKKIGFGFLAVPDCGTYIKIEL